MTKNLRINKTIITIRKKWLTYAVFFLLCFVFMGNAKHQYMVSSCDFIKFNQFFRFLCNKVTAFVYLLFMYFLFYFSWGWISYSRSFHTRFSETGEFIMFSWVARKAYNVRLMNVDLKNNYVFLRFLYNEFAVYNIFSCFLCERNAQL